MNIVLFWALDRIFTCFVLLSYIYSIVTLVLKIVANISTINRSGHISNTFSKPSVRGRNKVLTTRGPQLWKFRAPRRNLGASFLLFNLLKRDYNVHTIICYSI